MTGVQTCALPIFRLSESVILELTVAVQQGKETALDALYVEAVKNILQDKESDKSLLAMALSLPEESYLAQQMDIIDPDALHHARKFVRQELARLCKADLQDVWRENCIEGEYTLTPQAMGRRHLKNVCLSLLIAADSPDEKDITLAKQQYYEGDNMTEIGRASCRERV